MNETPGTIIALRHESGNTEFSGLVAWIDVDNSVKRCVVPVKRKWIDENYVEGTADLVKLHSNRTKEGYFQFLTLLNLVLIRSKLTQGTFLEFGFIWQKEFL